MKAYKVVVEKFQEEIVEKDYKHFRYGNPFYGDEEIEEIMNILIKVARNNVLAVPETYAYNYAMATFGVNFFNRDIYIFYIYETKLDWDTGVPRIKCVIL